MKAIVLSLFSVLVLNGGLFAMASKPESVSVQIHKEKRLPRSRVTIKFVELIEDSRCPRGVQCIWAGNAKIKVSVKRGASAAKVFEMDTNGPKNTITHSGYKITFTGLTPYPAENIRIDRNGYVASFSIEK